jgi:hypothetical protein
VPDPAPTPEAPPVTLDNFTQRNDEDVLLGHFGLIGAGEHEGKVGVFVDVIDKDEDGYPDTVHVELRNTGEIVVCAHSDLTPTDFGGR